MIGNTSPAISVGILAGGKSSRMGKNKALLKLENELVIERLIHEFGGFSEVIISAAKKGEYEEFGQQVVYDDNNDIGPIEGIRQVLLAANEEYVFICAADMPFLKKRIAEYIAGYICSDYDCYVIADEDHIQPLCAIYSKKALPVIEKLISGGRYRLREIFDILSTKYIPLELSVFDKKIVRNINTKDEYFDAIKPVVFCVSGYSNSGKTWLVSKLINEFISGGFTVAALKHDGHDEYSDLPGSDTDQYIRAGAQYTAIFSDTRYSVHYREKITAEDFISMMKAKNEPPDFLIIEGLKDSEYPKVGLIKDGICFDENTLICAVGSDTPDKLSCPVFGEDDVRGIFMCILDFFNVELKHI